MNGLTLYYYTYLFIVSTILLESKTAFIVRLPEEKKIDCC